ncbi:hypothetical protein [Paracoccus sp. DMF]|uniref:hypothetical protein n=1 Tax=Paracoccus sp. DMF TaxID=400837 RepID=UPI0021E3EB36|nr:hypothetical protein [Paracoccus sp. DMF]MCV2447238.1 hypothetical protein [Paracoccus sp. DMF]
MDLDHRAFVEDRYAQARGAAGDRRLAERPRRVSLFATASASRMVCTGKADDALPGGGGRRYQVDMLFGSRPIWSVAALRETAAISC